MNQKLPLEFFRNQDVIDVSRNLLGKKLYSLINGQLTGGIIVETEAYRGPEDRGAHTYNGKRTPRNEMIYGAGGLVYMYICYGIHDMLNVVTGTTETPHATLIRAVEPTIGLAIMRERRSVFNEDSRLCRGPGALAKAFALRKIHNGLLITGDEVWMEEGVSYNESEVAASPRIGMNFDGPYKTIPWRFYVKGNPNVTPPNR